MEKVRVAVIGLGARGQYIVKPMLLEMDNCEIVAVCDLYQDRVDLVVSQIKEETGKDVFGTTDYKEILIRKDVDAVLVVTSWETHVKIACEAMEAGIPTGLEVGGAYDLEECYDLVKTQVRTKTPFMFLENCCYGRFEMMAMNIVKQGLFGEIVHCEGAYQHDLRTEVLRGEEMRHYRLNNYINRNCENYPTHELGPIAQILDINRGNRMLYLTSMSSKSVGLNDYARLHPDTIQSKFADMKFNQGDVVTTNIMCSNGATISLMLDTCCGRPYSRNFTVHGTRGIYREDGNYVYFDTDFDEASHWNWSPNWNNALDVYAEKYDHPVWKKFLSDGVRGGHGGMDYLVYNEFLNYVINGGKSPIDVYDAAAWMCITPLSDISIREGSRPVEIPDFTLIK
ncbi:MAG: Gfo/Idh/MocA family oxidoreductase [Clostridia bacterium]|nr:Gfo/Idh/MocA family oxidoreductase [Clostridia bacterium]